MPIDAKQIIQVLNLSDKVDLEKIESEEEFKSIFEKEFTNKNNLDAETKRRVVGSEYGSVKTAMKRSFKNAGIDFDLTDEDFDKKKFSDLTEYAIDKVHKKLASQIEELKAKQGGGNDEKMKEIEAEFNKVRIQLQQESELKGKVMVEFDEFRKTSDGEKKNIKKNFELEQIKSRAIKFGSGVSDLEKRGFNADFNDKYDFDYHESGKLLPVHKDGSGFVADPKVTGKYLTPEELYEREGLASNVWEKAPQTNQRQQSNQPQNNFQVQPPNGAVQPPAGMPRREIAPAARI